MAFWPLARPACVRASEAASGPEVVLRGEDGGALLTLRPSGALRFDGDALRGDLVLDAVDLDSPWLRGVARGEARARIEADRIVFDTLTLRMDRAVLPVLEGGDGEDATPGPGRAGQEDGKREPMRLREGAATPLLLKASGVWRVSTSELRLDHVRLELGSGVVLEGGLRWSGDAGLEADLSLDAEDGAALSRLLSAVFPQSLSGLALRGPLRLGGRFSMAGAGDSDALSLSLEVRRPLGLRFADGGADLTLPRLKAALELRPGGNGQWDATGRVDAVGELAPGGVALSSPSISFEAGMSGGAYRLRRLTVSCPKGLSLAGKRLPLDSVTLSGNLLPLPEGAWKLADLRLSLPGGALTGKGEVDAEGRARGEFSASRLDLAALAPLLSALAGGEGWTAQGRLGVSGTLDMDGEGVRSDVRLRITDAGYLSPDGLDMGQGLGATLRLRSNLSLKTLRRWVNADLRLDRGEALAGAIYLNLADHPVHFTANANQIGADRFKDLKAGLDWTGFGKLRAEGDLWAHGGFDDWRYRGAAVASDVDLGAVFESFVASPRGLTRWQGSDAGLGGTGGFMLSVNADGTIADLDGRLRLSNASLRSADGDVDVGGAYLDLPVSYRIKGRARPPALGDVPEERLGTLRIARLRTPWSARENLALRMALVPNRFFLLDPIRIPLFGGRIRLDNLRCDDPLSREFRLSLNARFKDIDLAQWSRRSVPLSGVLHGDLGRITATRKRVDIPGSVEGDFFGGAVRADGFFMDWPLEARRQFGADVTVRRLDLERLSAALGIGRVTGLMDFDLKDLLFAYGQPARLVLTAETSGEGDFEKSVSLKAVNSLSVIGTGSGIGDMGVGLFASFFEEFSYARIGFQCILNNDRFQVRGLIRDGGVEYLIKKPFLTGINVVNGNPENYISFSDMLERVQRVVKGSPSSAPSETP